ncbi:cysteine desulfurase family protein [Enterococcus sp. AZ194]|uniref:cysteine desulfurase family protein n=1 Tax=Enterococcus sp. AZ194 TaxID=2774629 RepID=UPI003F68447A
MNRIYLDHAATTPIHPNVIAEMTRAMGEYYGNPSSIHSFGRLAHEQLELARQVVADSLQVDPHEIIFTSGGTESDNMAIIETAFSRQNEGRHLITTAIEHPAVMQTMKYLETQNFEVTYLPVDEKGNISLADFDYALREETTLVSIMFGNNEIGNLLPIKEIGERLREHPAYFHSDAVQAYGNQEIRPHELGIDLLSVSAHKLNGPKGVGFLFKSDKIKLPSLFHGGEQEEKRRPGTENLAGILGMKKAIERLTIEKQKENNQQYLEYKKQILSFLDEEKIAYKVNGDPSNSLAHIMNLHLVGVPNNLLLMKLDLKNIAVSTGSACTAGAVDPSHVLEAIYGKGDSAVTESIRISFGWGVTHQQIKTFCQGLVTSIKK